MTELFYCDETFGEVCQLVKTLEAQLHLAREKESELRGSLQEREAQVRGEALRFAQRDAEIARLTVIADAARDYVLAGKWESFRAMEDALGVRWEETVPKIVFNFKGGANESPSDPGDLGEDRLHEDEGAPLF